MLIVLLSIFPLFITYTASSANPESTLFHYRHFFGIASLQAIAQISLAWHLLTNKGPAFALLSLVVMSLLFQITYGIAVILLSIA